MNKQSVRDAIIYMMAVQRLNKWWVPRHMQACMWALGAKVSTEEVVDIMEDIFQESSDHPQNIYVKSLSPYMRYKCTAYFSPQTK